MVKPKQKIILANDGTVNIRYWLTKITNQYRLSDTTLLTKACDLTQKLTQGLTTFYGQSYLAKGLEIAEILLDLNLDQQVAATAIVSVINLSDVTLKIIQENLGTAVAKMAMQLQQINLMSVAAKLSTRHSSQTDNIRKMLLTMAADIRVVIIKLAECVSLLRGIKSVPTVQQQQLAQETLDIYAPLANRLGIGQLKWELEDLAFYYLDPLTYKNIAKFLSEKRIDRERQIEQLITSLKEKLTQAHLIAEVSGRAKHIYSIYLKAQRKNLPYQEIYDYSALRILVPTIEDCYTALSIVHHLWQPIIAEFDDYIAAPKKNGYRSIHTAVIDEYDKQFEIQLRTHSMHDEAERGIAAHWVYKENSIASEDHTTKIAYLRQLLDWHQEIAQTDDAVNAKRLANLHERVYVMTPAGDILDLSVGATPLDFAYHLHSELGHRCRGAKVNGQIVPLTYTLQTGDKVEIITIAEGTPSRDWLNAEAGYLKTDRARNKVNHWFKQQTLRQDITAGKQQLERELARQGLTKTVSISQIARDFDLKNEEALFVALSRGSIRVGQIMQLLQQKPVEKPITPPTIITQAKEKNAGSAIVGSSDLLTRFAKCCKPIPGDDIVGYITQGRGISIHKKNCSNIIHFSSNHKFLPMDWNSKTNTMFSTDLNITAQEQENVLHDLTALFSNEKVDLLRFNSILNKNQNKLFITLTIQVKHIEQLQQLLHRIQQLPSVISVKRPHL